MPRGGEAIVFVAVPCLLPVPNHLMHRLRHHVISSHLILTLCSTRYPHATAWKLPRLLLLPLLLRLQRLLPLWLADLPRTPPEGAVHGRIPNTMRGEEENARDVSFMMPTGSKLNDDNTSVADAMHCPSGWRSLHPHSLFTVPHSSSHLPRSPSHLTALHLRALTIVDTYLHPQKHVLPAALSLLLPETQYLNTL